ncbi:MAG: 4Fe-4S dicluster domain-containing protein [Thermodesulfobacteriota bacterium]
MGHSTDPDHPHRFLQHRLTRKVQANPASPTLMRILHLLFSPADAELAGRLPHDFTPVETLAQNLGIPADELNERLTEMARRGVVFDIECNGRRYVTLPPVVIGFFELVFMRARPDLPMPELARLFEQYFTENDGALARSFWQGQTQLARTLVREEAVPEEDHSEILDWERATQIVASATAVSVGTCQCLHVAEHNGNGCDKPPEVCLTFNYAAASMIRNGISRAISKNEALAVLAKSKEANLVQIGDNVQRNVSFICNCCSCCCHMLRGIKAYRLHKGVVSSNWIMAVDGAKCRGCGECARICPVEAIAMAAAPAGERGRIPAVLNAEICLGCGVCTRVCKSGAATMRSRPQRVLAPETVFDQRIAMAIERGRLADMIFDDPGSLSHRALGRLLAMLERTSPYKAAMACEAIKSSFLKAMVLGARRRAGDLTDQFS